jgi:hypothetical protein
MFLMQVTTKNVQAKRKNPMEEAQGTGAPSGSEHYREIASKLREIARECRFPGARREILDLASRIERRADDLDGRSGSAGSGQTTH